MHHKRRRPKKQRAGCLFCKPHKGNGMKCPPRGKRSAAALAESPAAAVQTY